MNATRLVEMILAEMEARSLSQMELCRETGIPQSTISRALKNPLRVTKTHRRLCKFIGISMDTQAKDRDGQEVLVKAVLDIWDGTPEHAQSLARLLRAGATLEVHAMSRATKPRKSNAFRQ